MVAAIEHTLVLGRWRGTMCAHTILRGRDAECAALDVLLDAARRGESRTVVLRGEAGVGKTALLDYTIGSAQDFRVLRSVGVESEMELAFASLHQLCAPILDRRGSLPGPQREALEWRLDLTPARLRMERPKPRRERPYDPLPLDPRDPDILRAKQLMYVRRFPKGGSRA